MPDAGILATVLLVLGLFLLALEFFIPSFGMIGITSLLCMVISFWSAWKAWGSGTNPVFFWTYVVFLCGGIPGTVIGSIYAIQYTSLGKVVVLQPPTPARNPRLLDELIGRTGVASTLLTPGGMVTIDDNRYHAESIGMLIDPGTAVIVTDTTAQRVIVRPLTPAELNVTNRDSTGSATKISAVHSPSGGDGGTTGASADAADAADPGKQLAVKSGPTPGELDFDIPDDYTG